MHWRYAYAISEHVFCIEMIVVIRNYQQYPHQAAYDSLPMQGKPYINHT